MKPNRRTLDVLLLAAGMFMTGFFFCRGIDASARAADPPSTASAAMLEWLTQQMTVPLLSKDVTSDSDATIIERLKRQNAPLKAVMMTAWNPDREPSALKVDADGNVIARCVP